MRTRANVSKNKKGTEVIKRSANRAARQYSKRRTIITHDFKRTIADRVERDPAFARAMLDEAATLFLNGEPGVARAILRDLVNATVGFEALAEETGMPSKSLHRMLSASGNPTMDNLATIFGAVRKSLKVELHVRATRAA